ncbi:hypothetical protein KPL74_19675 [Bacillus sp. NP157]|nr:hypothetical protein KPL74_19675 [Bacillus sp. NP157]
MHAKKTSQPNPARRLPYNQRAPDPRRKGLPTDAFLIDFRDAQYRRFYEGEMENPFPKAPQVTHMIVSAERGYVEHPQESDDHDRLVLHRPAPNWWASRGDRSIAFRFNQPCRVMSMAFYVGAAWPNVQIWTHDEGGELITWKNMIYDNPGWLTFEWRPDEPFYGIHIISMQDRGEESDIDLDYILLA